METGRDLEGGASLPWSWFVSEEVHRLEQERVFRNAWTYACPAAWVADPGTYAECRSGDVPLVVVRGRDGELRAFLNVCRHRGSQIVSGRGRRETLQCPYHAWTYDLDGTLHAAPRSEREQGFDRAQLSLRSALVRELGPLVFVCPDLDAPPLEEALGPVPGLLARDLDLGSLVFHRRFESELAANWKVAVENYLECYHCPVAHPEFSRLVETSPDAYTLEAGDGVWTQLGHARANGDSCQFHLVWPTMRINVYPGLQNLSVGHFWPSGPERTTGFLDYFFGADVPDEQARELIEVDDHVGREDAALVEGVQRGVRAGLIERGRLLLDSELLVNSFEKRLFTALS